MYLEHGFITGASWWFSKWKGWPRRTWSTGMCKQLNTYVSLFWRAVLHSCCSPAFVSVPLSDFFLGSKALSSGKPDQRAESQITVLTSSCTMSTWGKGQVMVDALIFVLL